MSFRTESVTDLVEEILRWENIQPTLRSNGLKLMVAERIELLRYQLLASVAPFRMRDSRRCP